MPSSKASGSQTATLDTEHALSTIVDAGTYVLLVDMANLADGETLQLKAKIKVQSTGTTRLAYHGVYRHGQSEPVVLSIPVPSVNECVFSLEQNGGTGRAFPWEIVAL